MTATMTDEEFDARLEAMEGRFPGHGDRRPPPEAFAAAYGDVDELAADPANLADEDRAGALRDAVDWLYRLARGWKAQVPEEWSRHQAERLGMPTVAEFTAAEEAFSARLAAAEVTVQPGPDGTPPGEEDFARAFRGLQELADDPAVQANPHWQGMVGVLAEVLYRQAASSGVKLPPEGRA